MSLTQILSLTVLAVFLSRVSAAPVRSTETFAEDVPSLGYTSDKSLSSSGRFATDTVDVAGLTADKLLPASERFATDTVDTARLTADKLVPSVERFASDTVNMGDVAPADGRKFVPSSARAGRQGEWGSGWWYGGEQASEKEDEKSYPDDAVERDDESLGATLEWLARTARAQEAAAARKERLARIRRYRLATARYGRRRSQPAREPAQEQEVEQEVEQEEEPVEAPAPRRHPGYGYYGYGY